jgi:hypothetical protein
LWSAWASVKQAFSLPFHSFLVGQCNFTRVLAFVLNWSADPGVLFICFNVDHRVLYYFSEEAADDGFQFYATFFNSPPAIKASREQHERCL